MSTRLVVVGAGVAGLAAAREARAAGAEVVVLEAADRVGGPLTTTEVAGVPLDAGAEQALVRQPGLPEAAAELGLELEQPVARSAAVLTARGLRRLPRTLLGVPLDLRDAARVLGPAGAARAAADAVLPPTPFDGDTAVGVQVRRRLGGAVADLLVAPLLGGVYAGDADRLSLRATVPALADPAGGSLLAQARAAAPAPSAAPDASGSSPFAAPAGGLGGLPAALARGLDVRLRTRVTGLRRRDGGGWDVAWEGGAQAGTEAADAVVLALPAFALAPLLRPLSPVAAGAAEGVPYASVALVALAFPRDTAGLLRDPASTGWLVPPSAGRVVKAVTVASSKWARVRDAAPDLVLVRASVGRWGDTRDVERSDRELVGVVAADVASVADVRARPVDSRVVRWERALPQYAVGHLDRVAALRGALPAGLAVAGAALDGVGVPACLRSGRAAARALLAARSDTGGHDGGSAGPAAG